MQSAHFDNTTSIVKDDLVAQMREGDKVSVAAATFSMYAYQELKQELEKVDSFRFIFTEPTFTPDREPRQRREFYIPKLQREHNLAGTQFEIRLKNELTQKAIATECADWVRRKAKFKSFPENGAHLNSMLVVDTGDDAAAYTPFDAFTTEELGCDTRRDTVGNLVIRNDTPNSRALLGLFDTAWKNGGLADVTETVIDGITVLYKENAPELVYYLALYRIFHEFLDDVCGDVLPREGTGFRESVIWGKLYDFQRDAALAIINKLETYNGCILADSVGLGKTYTALAVIKYYESRNCRVLVLCPKKLCDNWTTFNSNVVNNPIAADRLGYDVLFHTDLSRTRGTSATGLALDRINWGAYDLVVIDESHNFRNGGDSASNEKMNRYQLLMDKVIGQGVKTKVLMLSATPVNNRFRDLRNQLALAYEGDPGAWDEKLDLKGDIETVFSNAQRAYREWTKLPVGMRTTERLTDMLDYDFFSVLDAVTVARSRKHIQRYYDTSAIGPFPQRNKPITKRPCLSTLPDAINYTEIYDQLEGLKLAVYIPSAYLQPSKRAKYEPQADGDAPPKALAGREEGLRRLMSTNLLKRLESSVHAFQLTLERMQHSMRDALATIERFEADGDSSDARADAEMPQDYDFDPDDENAFEVGESSPIALADMDWISWKQDIEVDLETIELLISMIGDIDPAHDAKLLELTEQIREKVAHPINPGNDKVLVFTAFADTARYLYEHIGTFARDELGLASALVCGDACSCNVPDVHADMGEILTCFSPVSKERDVIAPHLADKDISILIATDCISEGQNLQDCDFVVNYDIHWNPVRIVQRFGRVDRIGSKMERIQLVNYWPDMELDAYIKLKERVESRMRASIMAATGDDDPINEGESGDLAYRRQQLEQMQEEVVDLEDVQGGISITDLGLAEFHMDLVEYYHANPDIDRLPSGIHAVVEGEQPGVVFVLRNCNPGVNTGDVNRLHPFYVVHVADDGSIVHGHLKPKATLDAMRVLCRGKAEPDTALCRAYNRSTKNGRDMRREAGLLKDAVASIVDAKRESDVESFFSDGTTGFLESDIAGLDDFELVCFLVVRPAC